ncbi:hypothetical protein K505DRAFT_326521 [Melanomma pulvis-pyrius CBS 109.77]|uniref:Uncharacterized protein n=1 Tax=Melanomma pulvis-pyrius CBS 109.77 TaxID=1314802 RepID=A0A6A6X794_9PLEO|nr:hypothetical protein K505DRAFT_326521 [Melanomma pulvis-pyrius CBS 109.77]
MYDSLQLPWTFNPSPSESQYRDAGGVNTKGTIYLLPPPTEVLEEAFRTPPRARSEMSSGAIALCKHFERGGASSEHGRPHPFWTLPVGSNQKKDEIANSILQSMLNNIAWKNVMLLHRNVAVYEIRNKLGYGMRWTLDVEEVKDTISSEKTSEQSSEQFGVVDGIEVADTILEEKRKTYNINKTTFRGFVEPIIGLDCELQT